MEISPASAAKLSWAVPPSFFDSFYSMETRPDQPFDVTLESFSPLMQGQSSKLLLGHMSWLLLVLKATEGSHPGTDEITKIPTRFNSVCLRWPLLVLAATALGVCLHSATEWDGD